MSVAVIPARGGSKRIPDKNIRTFAGKPIIAYSIMAARESGCFDRVVVSTDSDEIAEVALKYGAEIPFLRPSEISDDHTPTIPVIRHAITALQRLGERPEIVACVYATAPFLRGDDLRNAYNRLLKCASFVFGVTEYRFPIQRALRRSAEGNVSMFTPDHFATRSQDLEPAWHDAGQFYLARAETWLTEEVIFQSSSIGLALSPKRVQDIDTLADWEQAELMFEALSRKTATSHSPS